MKLIIEIPNKIYNALTHTEFDANLVVNEMRKSIANGTPISDNATNGEIIKTMFDTTEEHFYDEDRMVDVYGLDRTDEPSTFYADWWNALYER